MGDVTSSEIENPGDFVQKLSEKKINFFSRQLFDSLPYFLVFFFEWVAVPFLFVDKDRILRFFWFISPDLVNKVISNRLKFDIFFGELHLYVMNSLITVELRIIANDCG